MEEIDLVPEEPTQRSKRRRVDKSGRSEALAKLRDIKGKKNKYSVEEFTPVYDVVHEDAYKTKVLEKASENWLEEDDEGGYVEDGREIFDEDEDTTNEHTKTKGKKLQHQKKQIKDNTNETKSIPKISKFFGRDALSKKDHKKDVGADVLLDKVLNELSNKPVMSTNVGSVAEHKVVEPKAFNTSNKDNISLTNDSAEPLPIILHDDPFADEKEEPLQKVEKETKPNISKPKNDAINFKGWEAAKTLQNMNDDAIDATQVFSLETDEKVNMWLWDIWEDPLEHRGQLFLFGKIEKNGTYSSVCVQIVDVENRLHLLPRRTDLNTGEDVSMKDVYEEFSTTIANTLDISEHRCKQVTKNHVFDVPGIVVPQVSDYLMVCYSGSKRHPLPNKPYKKIAYIFGTDVSATETLIMEKEIKGPCWITISNFMSSDVNLSWCNHHIKCQNMSSVAICADLSLSPPPLSIMSLNLRVGVDGQKNEVVAISCLVNQKFHIEKPAPKPPFQEHFCLLSHPSNKPFPYDFKVKATNYTDTKLIKLDNEIALLNCFLTKIHQYDPDLIVTQDAYARQLDVLCSRMISKKVHMWSKLGKLRLKTKYPANKKIEDFFIGRMVCDVKSSAEELKSKMRSYDLQSLCTNILKISDNERREVYADEIHSFYETTENLLELITLTMQDNLFSMRIMCELNCLPLALQITNIAGNLMSHTLRGGRAERNEFLLLHAFTKLNHIPPEKQRRDRKQKTDADGANTKKKAQFTGGLVLDPIKGFYDKFILLMDFNSLYPSIIQEYNICYTTIDKTLVLPDANTEMGILPFQIKKLVERRRQVKSLMKAPDLSEELKMQYDIRQMALKLTANSMYGCLGFSHSRFYAPHLAALVTEKGRDILMNTKSLVEKQAHQVVYGDTDSIMVLTTSDDYDQVLSIGNTIKQVINKIYKHIELDIDGIFKYLLLLKKKKYAATLISRGADGKLKETKEFKGLDIVRRDWCKLAQNAGEKVLDEILSDKSTDDRVSNIHKILEDIKKNFDERKIELLSLEITKQLTKAINEYNDISSLPHVQVALKMNNTMNRNFKKGDIVGYVICKDGTDESHVKRAYHLDELKCNKSLEIDEEYYIANQLYPVISRLIEPVNGIEPMRIAECLGMDPKKYKISVTVATTDNDKGESIKKSNAEKYRFCHKFIFSCYDCNALNPVAGTLRPDKTSPFEKCSNSECKAKPFKFVSSIENQLITTIRKDIKRFYENWFICDDPLCSNNTKITTHVTELGKPTCTVCGKGVLIRQYSEKDLFNQLCYYKHILTTDSSEGSSNANLSEEVCHLRDSLLDIIEEYLKESGYFLVKMSLLYKGVKEEVVNDKKLCWSHLLKGFEHI